VGVKVFQGISELQEAVGSHLGHSAWHEVTQEQVNLFADATGDHQGIHVDPDRAAAGPFGAPIAHGYLTLSLVPILSAEVYRVDGVRMALNYGANRVRFPAPLKVGSRVRGGVQLDSVEPSSLGFTLAATVTVEIEGVPKPACVAQTLVVIVP
jgi:acyl dehydratase